MKNLITAGIQFYRRWISPCFPASCRFYPTCSAYSMEAIRRHGALKGSALTARRLLKCHPWNSGGFDPVPGVEEKEGSGCERPVREFPADSACCEKTFIFLSAPRSPGPLKR